mmetsp:Transcript_30702/g.88638  ORF Transcript_30702/g.88638 Transcript_30702/m.88638 type:complete len:100 (-) Transcript_30702:859-1158(-)
MPGGFRRLMPAEVPVASGDALHNIRPDGGVANWHPGADASHDGGEDAKRVEDNICAVGASSACVGNPGVDSPVDGTANTSKTPMSCVDRGHDARAKRIC